MLLLLITVICVWIAALSHRARTQRAAIELVEKANGKISFSYEARSWPLPYTEFPSDNTFDPTRELPGPKWLQQTIGEDYFRSVVYVGLADRKSGSDALMNALRELPNLHWLDLARNDVTDDMLSQIAEMKQLRVLVLDRNPELTDEGLAKLMTLTELERLDLSLMKGIQGTFLREASRLRKLRELDVQDTSFQGENLAFLAGHPQIHRLTLPKTNIKDDHLRYLPEMPELRLLSIGHTPVTEKGLVHLKKVPLIHLYIRGENVTSEWVPHLSQMRTLEYLSIRESKMEPTDIEELKAAIPNCDIDYRD